MHDGMLPRALTIGWAEDSPRLINQQTNNFKKGIFNSTVRDNETKWIQWNRGARTRPLRDTFAGGGGGGADKTRRDGKDSGERTGAGAEQSASHMCPSRRPLGQATPTADMSLPPLLI